MGGRSRCGRPRCALDACSGRCPNFAPVPASARPVTDTTSSSVRANRHEMLNQATTTRSGILRAVSKRHPSSISRRSSGRSPRQAAVANSTTWRMSPIWPFRSTFRRRPQSGNAARGRACVPSIGSSNAHGGLGRGLHAHGVSRVRATWIASSVKWPIKDIFPICERC